MSSFPGSAWARPDWSDPPGEALVFGVRPALPLAWLAARLWPAAALFVFPPLRLESRPPPDFPGPDWVLLRPAFTGICGSDVTEACLLADRDNPLSAIVSFPHVMGHEVVARIAGTGAEVDDLEVGTWVVVDPWLGCVARGSSPLCPGCGAGHPPLCSRIAERPSLGPGRGMHLGNAADLPGGFATLMIAHRSQCHPIPAGLDPAWAVLADPLAVAWHAVSRVEGPSDPAVVLGAGTLGLAVTAAWRLLHPQSTVIVTAAWPHSARAVRTLGAVPCAVDTRAVVETVARYSGGRPLHPWAGQPWLSQGGAPVVIDAVGTAETLDTALRVVAPSGRIVKVGVGRAGRLDTTLAYYKEAGITGSNGYGWSETGGVRMHELDQALALLAAGRVPAREWLTHSYPLRAWRRAFATAARPGRTRAIKVTVRPTSGEPHSC